MNKNFVVLKLAQNILCWSIKISIFGFKIFKKSPKKSKMNTRQKEIKNFKPNKIMSRIKSLLNETK